MKAITKAGLTRDFIIERTADIFNKKGFAGTSLSDLTQATGLTKGSIYGNFGNKEEVALAVFDYNHNKVTQLVQTEMDKAATASGKLLAYAGVYRAVSLGKISKGGCPILNTAIESDDTHPLLRKKAAAALSKWEKNLTQVITGGIQSGEFKKSVNIRQASLSLIALVEGGIMISRVTRNPDHMEQIINTVKSYIGQLKK